MKILFTGASSFTGMWFARELAAAGHQVTATLTRQRREYAGLRLERINNLSDSVIFQESTRFGDDPFLALVEKQGPWDLLCHHASEMANYRSADFDPFQALQNNAARLPRVLTAFQQAGGRGVLLTGSVFEPDEGIGNEPRRAFSPYGLSKGLTWQCFRYYAEIGGLRLGKFTIPNPIGPWEEPRFTSYLIRTWKDQQTAEVKTPDYIRDNIPVDLLATCYARFAQGIPEFAHPIAHCHPSGYVESQGAFAERFARAMRSRLALDCSLRLLRQTDFSEPLMRINHEPARALAPDWDETRFWDATAAFYRKTHAL
jgi:UDP-glucose 4-epimerase